MTMRRFGSRWRDATTPVEVLDIFKIEGCFEILIRNHNEGNPSDEWVDGIEIEESGFAKSSFELEPYEARQYRYRNSHKRLSWDALPPRARQVVADWLSQ